MSSIFYLLYFCFISYCGLAAPIQPVNENDLISNRKAMIQTHTGYNQTEIHAVLGKLKTYRLKIQKIVNEELVGPEILIDPTIEARDPNKELLEKLNIFHIDDLDPNSEYHLELLEVSSTSALTTDRRRFRTLDPAKTDVQFTAASCACDEDRYNPVKAPIWTQKRLTKPDFMFFIGDITYVDSFEFVAKPDITTQNIWQRYFASFLDNPVARSYRMTPLISTWDDHDSSNNANKYTPTLKESLILFNLMYGGRTIPGVIENGPEGTYKWLTYGNSEFSFFDGRTFRENFDTTTTGPQRYGQFGQAQEDWFFKRAALTSKPLVLIKGDMWGSETITEVIPAPGVGSKRITESFFGDHPFNYSEFMKQLQALPNPYIFISGDIHRAQFIRHGPNQTGARWNPFVTAEYTTSPLYSFRYNADDPNSPPWPDKDRYATKNIYNFGFFKITSNAGTVKFEVEIRGDGQTKPDGSPADWTQLAEPVLKDTLVINSSHANPARLCSRFYSPIRFTLPTDHSPSER